jgi:hypothetical protein
MCANLTTKQSTFILKRFCEHQILSTINTQLLFEKKKEAYMNECTNQKSPIKKEIK